MAKIRGLKGHKSNRSPRKAPKQAYNETMPMIAALVFIAGVVQTPPFDERTIRKLSPDGKKLILQFWDPKHALIRQVMDVDTNSIVYSRIIKPAPTYFECFRSEQYEAIWAADSQSFYEIEGHGSNNSTTKICEVMLSRPHDPIEHFEGPIGLALPMGVWIKNNKVTLCSNMRIRKIQFKSWPLYEPHSVTSWSIQAPSKCTFRGFEWAPDGSYWKWRLAEYTATGTTPTKKWYSTSAPYGMQFKSVPITGTSL
ncbi:MAG TPA: hypothetical protein VK171_01365 [Fimbriimonas sp.]|nr:hypothetical protein [Fimbriimonas sp.]